MATYNYDCVHIDPEAWYFILADGRAIKEKSPTSKRHVDKVMFLAALAQPHSVYSSRKFGDLLATGKILVHSTIEIGECTSKRIFGRD